MSRKVEDGAGRSTGNNDSTMSDSAPSTPPYGGIFGTILNDQAGFGTEALLTDDGRIDIRIDEKASTVSSLLLKQLEQIRQKIPDRADDDQPPLPSPRSNPPPLNIVIHVVGSRGDAQPFVALGKVLTERYRHRVRLATHPVFRGLIEDNGLEFFDVGGDPSELMAFMVKNPGLMPGFDTLRRGDVGRRRKELGSMITRFWRSCYETGDGTGAEASDRTTEAWMATGDGQSGMATARPFVADAIIANPPSFAHLHCAEKMGVPLHMMFTMPWSPTQSFPHPLANIQSSNADASLTNWISYALVEMMTWQGLCDVINRFRQNSLGLEPLSLTWAPGMLARLRIPYTYCWSPALIPKPRDWAAHITVSGFYFLSSGASYTPDPDLKAFLAAGPPPVYIGFGSIVLDDPNAMTELIFTAIKKTRQRALVSKGWGGFGGDHLTVPEGVFMLGNVPHDWLFKQVSCVVHHGGAGTTAAGIACGKPTVVIPFFGDQPFWGAMVARAGAGPLPIRHKELTADNLAAAIQKALEPTMMSKAEAFGRGMAHEKGTEVGAQRFHQMLDGDEMRCHLAPERAAVWWLRKKKMRLSALAAAVLTHDDLIDVKDLKLFRHREYDTEDEPWDPFTGGASALVGTLSSMSMGVADLPVEALKALKIHPDAQKSKSMSTSSSGTDSSTAPSQPPQQRPEVKDQQQSPNSETSSATMSPSAPQGYNVEEALASLSKKSSSTNTSQNVNKSSSARAKSYNVQEAMSAKFDLDAAVGTTLSAARIAGAGIKSPMDFTSSLARGFHNAPKLYGDTSVRKSEKITDLSSGLRAAGKEFQFGLYDGISGLVTQPLEGARKEGATGFFKGFAKGIGGVVFKPAAAFWGIPGHTSMGIYKELRKRFGPSVEGYIVASRTAQGFAELDTSSADEREAVLTAWANAGAIPSTQLAQKARQTTQPPANDEELEEAIRRSVAESSRGNAEEDAAVETAIRASVADLEAVRAKGAQDEELQRAMEASVADAQRGVYPISACEAEQRSSGFDADAGAGVSNTTKMPEASAMEVEMTDEEAAAEEAAVLKYVMRQSLAEERARKARTGEP